MHPIAWITTDTSRVALALARTRLLAGRFPYYLPTDSLDGVQLALASELAATEGEAGLRRLNGNGESRLEEWEVPREADPGWSDPAKEMLSRWWEHRRARQQEMDDSIARRAETETLYDQPYEDNKRVRVTGPFTGAGQPYDKLKRALRAEIDEAAWASLCATRSRPFPPPASGRVAVKVINHYGDEVMKVFAVE